MGGSPDLVGECRIVIRDLVRRPAGMAGVGLIVLACLTALLGPVVLGVSPIDGTLKQRHLGPSRTHPFGTDFLGRDILARIVHGARTSLGAASLVMCVTIAIAVAVGVAAGYAGGRVDAVLMRLTAVVLAFPSLVLALAVAGLLGPSLRNAMVALTLAWWAGPARIVRAEVLSIRQRPYVEAAVAAGGSAPAIVVRHILPNIAPTILVLATLDIGAVIGAMAALSYLGLGNQPPAPEWGRMLFDAKAHLERYPREMFVPGCAIVITVVGFTLLGDALRDVFGQRSE